MENKKIDYPDFLELVNRRYSCRKYSSTPITKEEILAVIETARIAPSAVNRQPWKFLILNTPELCDVVRACYGRDWVDSVPAFIVALGNHDEAWHRATDDKDHTDIDIAIAVEHICLAATSLNLGSCWICNFDAKKCSEMLNIPQEWEPVAIIPIGHGADDATIPEKKRKTITEIVKWGSF
ncbi:MAG: nitroreductase family protein [Muribaculaceae bacterium]